MAISLLVVFHVGDGTLDHAPLIAKVLVQNAYQMLPFLLVLSGFVITYGYAEPICTGRLQPSRFLMSRTLRLWPIYLIALTLHFTLVGIDGHGLPVRYAGVILSQALFLQGWIPPTVWYGNVPGWTISVEVFLYAVFPWLIVRVYRMPMRSGWVLAGAALLVSQSVALAYVLVKPDGFPPKSGPSSFYLDLLRFLPPMHLASFLVGVMTARLYLEDRVSGRSRNGSWLTFAGAAPLAVFLCGVPELLARRLQVSVWLFPFLHSGLMSPLWGLLILGVCHGGVFTKFFSNPVLARLGDASYGLYILQTPMLDLLLLAYPSWNRTPLFLPQYFFLMLPLCVLSFERFEQPLRATLLARISARIPQRPNELEKA